MKALIIDDDDFTSEMLASFLKANGLDVEKAFNLLEGKKIIFERTPDMVFLDIMLPDGNGIDLLVNIRKTFKDLPVIMITGFKDCEKVVTAFRQGANDCLLKPFNYEYLKNDILVRYKDKEQ